MTNIRFNHDHTKVITTGGADQSIFQWRFHPDGFRDGDGGLSEAATGYVDSDDGLSDSDASDLGELDSDVENVSILLTVTVPFPGCHIILYQPRFTIPYHIISLHVIQHVPYHTNTKKYHTIPEHTYMPHHTIS